MLTADDPLPRTPSRVLVAGVSGAGKSTLAARIAAVVGAEHHEIDALHWGPEWTPRPTFVDDVDAFSAASAWVAEWQYREVRPLLVRRADTLVWLDLPRRVAFARVIRRTVRRRFARTRLWAGNVEPPLHTIVTDPERNIIRYAVRTSGSYTAMVADAEAAHPDLTVVRLGSQREVDRWLQGALAQAVVGG